jgi:hypothetical protein
MALGFKIMLIYTTDGTIESNTEHFTRIQELLFPVNSVLPQSVLQAHSLNAGIEHSTSLRGTLIHLSNTLQYADTIPLRSVFQLPRFTISNFLASHSPTHCLASQHFFNCLPSTQRSHSRLISCLSHALNAPMLFEGANYMSYLLLVLVHSGFMTAWLYRFLR